MLQVIGAGFGRTGTHSLGLALEKLGFGPCYNILKVTPEDNKLWSKALNNELIDWDQLFAGCKSAVEWPMVAFLPKILTHYSDAKVVLTLRDPESWYQSAIETIFEGLELSAHNPDPLKRDRSKMKRRLILEYTFHNRYRDRAYALEVYRRHNHRVVDMVPPKRLLKFDVKEGWEPLCNFLDRPVPEEPFPHLNERTDFLATEPEWAKEIKKSVRSGSIE